MEVIDVLKETRDLILDEDAWTQGTYARDADGDETGLFTKNACCWCLLGAIQKVSKDADIDAQNKTVIFMNEMARNRCYSSLTMFNDSIGRKHVDVIEFLEESMSELRAE